MAAPGPSLSPVRDGPVVAVQDAWRVIPQAEVLYACDRNWWHVHDGCPQFEGEKWSCHDTNPDSVNDKSEVAERWGVRCVRGVHTEPAKFSRDPTLLTYGDNSGFQAVNLAILFGCTHITLIGFDMQVVGGKRHFFGDHPSPLGNGADYSRFAKRFAQAAETLEGVRIVNATPGSALTCFPMMTFDEAMQERDAIHDHTAP